MNDALHANSTTRTVAVVLRHALELEHAVDVLVAEFGFDATFLALAEITDDRRAHRAMYLAVAQQSREVA